jgi:hypothetical protein
MLDKGGRMDAMEWLRQWEDSPQVRDLVKQLSVLTNDFQAAHAVDDERFVLKAAGAFFVHVAVATATQHGIPTCCGLQWKSIRLAIEHPFWPTIIDSGACVRPTFIAPEPTVLILGSQSCRVGPHYYTASFLHDKSALWLV